MAWNATGAIYQRPIPQDVNYSLTYTWVGGVLMDQQDAAGLLYRRNRYYDPTSGRFSQEDPIGLAGGVNVYGFAAGDPVNYSDPFGLRDCPAGYVAAVDGGTCFNEVAVLGMAITGVFETAEVGLQALAGLFRASKTARLAADVQEIHGALDPIAQGRRTTAVLETTDGTKIAGGGARDLTPAQRAAAARVGAQTAKQAGAHAEVTALEHAKSAGLRPDALAVSRPICAQCRAAIQSSGGRLTSPTTATWPE